MTETKMVCCYISIAGAAILGVMGLIKETAYAQQKRSTSTQQTADDSSQRAVEIVSKSVGHGSVLEFTMCEIRSAFWGEYDVEIRVSANTTTDQKPRTFRVSKGKFTESIDKEGISLLASLSKKGLVRIGSQEEAFKKGIPFYIYDVAVDSSGSPTFTVVSNPNVSTERAFARLQSVS